MGSTDNIYKLARERSCASLLAAIEKGVAEMAPKPPRHKSHKRGRPRIHPEGYDKRVAYREHHRSELAAKGRAYYAKNSAAISARRKMRRAAKKAAKAASVPQA